jgi:Biotin carboxylase, N-terminal domain
MSVGRVVVANRGEMALRAIRASRRFGLENVAVYSSADDGFLSQDCAFTARCAEAGLTTTVPFHAHRLQQPEFTRAEVHPRWIEDNVRIAAQQ